MLAARRSSRVKKSWAWQSGARRSSHFCSTTPKAPQPSSACPRDKWWNLALRSRFESAFAPEADVQRHGPLDLCRAVSIGANSPKRSGGFEARYRYKVAPRRVPIVLALEVTTSWWPTNLTDRDTQAYPRDEHRQPAVGRAADPRRVA